VGPETHVHKITCFFIWRLDLMILMRANPLLMPLDIARIKSITSCAI
jgi:hypothetical protein